MVQLFNLLLHRPLEHQTLMLDTRGVLLLALALSVHARVGLLAWLYLDAALSESLVE